MTSAVFFDAVGTLFEATEPIGHSYARIARKHGLAVGDAEMSAAFHRAFSAAPALAFGAGHPPAQLRRLERGWWYRLVEDTFRGLGEFDDFDAFFDELFAYFGQPESWKPVAAVPELLCRLKESETRLGIISNLDHRIYGILDGLDLARYFDSITISSEAGFAKPAREIFQRALSSAGVSAHEAVHVGDSELADLKGASAAGMAAILIDPRIDGREIVRADTARVGSLASVIRVARMLRSS
jgi:putative hydrolase of the HAD superfamily